MKHPIVLVIDLGQETEVAGIKVWNYNASFDATFCGVKHGETRERGESKQADKS